MVMGEGHRHKNRAKAQANHSHERPIDARLAQALLGQRSCAVGWFSSPRGVAASKSRSSADPTSASPGAGLVVHTVALLAGRGPAQLALVLVLALHGGSSGRGAGWLAACFARGEQPGLAGRTVSEGSCWPRGGSLRFSVVVCALCLASSIRCSRMTCMGAVLPRPRTCQHPPSSWVSPTHVFLLGLPGLSGRAARAPARGFGQRACMVQGVMQAPFGRGRTALGAERGPAGGRRWQDPAALGQWRTLVLH